MYDFNREIERKGTNCVKWDSDFVTDNVMPMWIADMDFEAAPAIVKSLQKTVSQGVYGYTFLSEKYYQSVMNWMIRRHEYKLEREEISFVPNVVIGLSFAIQSISEPGDEILVPTPVYGPFFSVVNNNNRILVESPMKNEDGYYTMDFEDLESRITPKTKAVIFCAIHIIRQGVCGHIRSWKNWQRFASDIVCILYRMIYTVNLFRKKGSMNLSHYYPKKCAKEQLHLPLRRRHLTLQGFMWRMRLYIRKICVINSMI